MRYECFLACESFGYGLVRIEVNGESWANSFLTYEAAIAALEHLHFIGPKEAEEFRATIFPFPEGHSFRVQRDFDEAALKQAGFVRVSDATPG